MRLELTRIGLLVELANHYTTRGALVRGGGGLNESSIHTRIQKQWRYSTVKIFHIKTKGVVLCYFIRRRKGIAFIVRSYLNFF